MNPNLLIVTHLSTEALVLLSQIHWALPSPKAVTSFIDINVSHALVFYKRTEYLFIDQKTTTIVWRIFHEEREGNNNWQNESGNQSSRLIIKSNETKKKWYKTSHNFLIGREMLSEISTWNLQIIPMRQICFWRFLISFIVKKNYCKVVIIW